MDYLKIVEKHRKDFTKYIVIISGFVYLFIGIDFITSIIFGIILSFMLIYYIDNSNNNISGDNLLGNIINIIGEFMGFNKLIPNISNLSSNLSNNTDNNNVINNDIINDIIDNKYNELDKFIDKKGGNLNNVNTIDNVNNIQPKYDGFMKLVLDLKKMIKLLTNYILTIKNKVKDKSYNKLVKKIVKLFKKFTNHLKKFFISINSEFDYPNLIYQEIKDIENKIYNEIHSLHFKLDVNSDKDIFNYSNEIIKGIKYINIRLEEYIEKDMKNDINSGKSSLQAKTNEPQPINTNGIDNHILEI